MALRKVKNASTGSDFEHAGHGIQGGDLTTILAPKVTGSWETESNGPGCLQQTRQSWTIVRRPLAHLVRDHFRDSSC